MRRAFWMVVSAAAVAWIAAPHLGAVAESAENTTVSTVEIKEETDAYRIELSYPKFGIPAADAHVQSIVKKAIAGLKADSEPASDSPKYELSGDYSHVYIGADVISARFDINVYLGGAHGLPAAYGLNFDPATGKVVTLDEALALIGKTLEQVSIESMVQLNAKLGSVRNPKGAAPTPENYSTFLIGSDAVTFIFQPYQVGSFSEGMPEVEFQRLTGRHELSRNSEKSDGAQEGSCSGVLVKSATGLKILEGPSKFPCYIADDALAAVGSVCIIGKNCFAYGVLEHCSDGRCSLIRRVSSVALQSRNPAIDNFSQ